MIFSSSSCCWIIPFLQLPFCFFTSFSFSTIFLTFILPLSCPLRHHRRINAVLRPALPERPDALLQAWQELLELRINQSVYSQRFPIDHRLIGGLRRCGTNADSTGMAPNSAMMLSPKSIEIYGEIGHLTRICPEKDYGILAKDADATLELPNLIEDFRQNCTFSLSDHHELPSLAQIIGTFAAGEISLALSDAMHKDIQSWTREVVAQIQSIPGYEKKWKLLVIAPGLHDIRQGQSPSRLAHSILQSVHIIRHKLPRRTFLLVLRHSYFAFWHALARSSSFCAKVIGLWNWEERERTDRAWEEIELRLSANFQSEDFYVEIADLFDQGRPLPGPDRMPDVSIIGPDCAHLSARGLSLLHAQLWNWLLQPQARSKPFVPLVRPLLCPRPHCPFLLTSQNRLSCPRLPIGHHRHSAGRGVSGASTSSFSSLWAALVPLAFLLAICCLLCALLVSCTLPSSSSSSSSLTAPLLASFNALLHTEGREGTGEEEEQQHNPRR